MTVEVRDTVPAGREASANAPGADLEQLEAIVDSVDSGGHFPDYPEGRWALLAVPGGSDDLWRLMGRGLLDADPTGTFEGDVEVTVSVTDYLSEGGQPEWEFRLFPVDPKDAGDRICIAMPFNSHNRSLSHESDTEGSFSSLESWVDSGQDCGVLESALIIVRWEFDPETSVILDTAYFHGFGSWG